MSAYTQLIFTIAAISNTIVREIYGTNPFN